MQFSDLYLDKSKPFPIEKMVKRLTVGSNRTSTPDYVTIFGNGAAEGC
jgi:hypothetical protein